MQHNKRSKRVLQKHNDKLLSKNVFASKKSNVVSQPNKRSNNVLLLSKLRPNA